MEAVRDFATLPGPEAFWLGGWQGWPELAILLRMSGFVFFSLALSLKRLPFVVVRTGLWRLLTWGAVELPLLNSLFCVKGGRVRGLPGRPISVSADVGGRDVDIGDSVSILLV